MFKIPLEPFPEFAAQTDDGKDASGVHDSSLHQVKLGQLHVVLIIFFYMSDYFIFI